MASIAHKVFTIPELLEQILNAVTGNEHAFDDVHDEKHVISRNQLYTLQRVCKSFQDTITDSIALRRRMLLEYQTSANPTLPLFTVDWLYATRSGHFLTPFFRYFTDVRIETLGIAHIDLDMLCPPRPEDLTPTPAAPDAEAEQPRSEESWRGMKLTFLPIPSSVSIGVYVYGEKCGDYVDEQYYSEGEGTLGDLVEYLQRAGERSHEEHEQRLGGSEMLDWESWIS